MDLSKNVRDALKHLTMQYKVGILHVQLIEQPELHCNAGWWTSWVWPLTWRPHQLDRWHRTHSEEVCLQSLQHSGMMNSSPLSSVVPLCSILSSIPPSSSNMSDSQRIPVTVRILLMESEECHHRSGQGTLSLPVQYFHSWDQQKVEPCTSSTLGKAEDVQQWTLNFCVRWKMLCLNQVKASQEWRIYRQWITVCQWSWGNDCWSEG